MTRVSRKTIERAAEALAQAAPRSQEEARAASWLGQLLLWSIPSIDAAALWVVRVAYAAGIAEGRRLARVQHADDLLEQARSFE